jgi:hypothetical protein
VGHGEFGHRVLCLERVVRAPRRPR